jgi:hypothetical protein
MQPSVWCGVDQEASGVRLARECPTCGHQFWEPGRFGPYIVVDGRTWNGADIFRLDAYPAAQFCTERVKVFIEGQGFTNVAFEPRGEIGDAAAASGPVGPFLRKRIEAPAEEPTGDAPSQQSLFAEDVLEDLLDPEGVQPHDDTPPIAYLPGNAPLTDPEDLQYVVEYLAIEVPDEEISADDLEFVRTAEIDGWRCWLWSFVDLYGEDCYVAASVWPSGGISVLYDPARGRTAEQFIWFDYRLYQRDA